MNSESRSVIISGKHVLLLLWWWCCCCFSWFGLASSAFLLAPTKGAASAGGVKTSDLSDLFGCGHECCCLSETILLTLGVVESSAVVVCEIEFSEGPNEYEEDEQEEQVEDEEQESVLVALLLLLLLLLLLQAAEVTNECVDVFDRTAFG